VRNIGVTGHGTQIAAMHLRSLERFDFDSVLFPHNYVMMQDPRYAAMFERFVAEVPEAERGSADDQVDRSSPVVESRAYTCHLVPAARSSA
jgi:hypothetical protein